MTPTHGEPSPAVWKVVTEVYAAYMEKDRPRLVGLFTDDCTLWESSNPRTRFGHEMKASAAEPEAWRMPVALRAINPDISVWAHTALVRHELQAQFADPSLDESLRVTAVLRRTPSGWRIVHHHEELLRN
ncbi:nuclear transport factor 2 family protein [Microbacterium saperdae]